MRTLSPVLARTFAGTLAVLGAASLAGCAPTVPLEAAPDANTVECAEISVRLPQTIGDLDRRTTDAQATAAWGQPAAVLYRCGLLDIGPSDLPCFDVDGVDWLLDESNAPRYVFTTYGRTPTTEVIVDVDYIAGADAVRAISAAVAAVPSAERCLAATDVFGSAQIAPEETPAPSTD